MFWRGVYSFSSDSVYERTSGTRQNVKKNSSCRSPGSTREKALIPRAARRVNTVLMIVARLVAGSGTGHLFLGPVRILRCIFRN